MGIFWDDPPGKKLKNCAAYIMPDIPDTGWEMPREFPNLQHAKCLAIDVETYDPELIERGPGWARGKGHLVGVSIAADGFKGYYPMRHEVEPHINIPPDKVLAWLNDVLSNEHAPKLGANIMYDVGWLRQEGVDVKGKLIDLQYAEALLTEDGRVGLEHLGQKYLGLGKESSDLYKWCAAYYGGAANDRQRKNIYRAPARLVGHYAESDAALPFQLAGPMYRALERDGLLDVFDMECRLIPLLIDMRFAGVSVDINRAEQARVKLLSMADEAAAQIRHIVGFDVNVNAAASLAKAFDKIGLKYPRTAPSASYPEGQPSFTKLSLKATDHKVARLIEDQKKYLKTVGTFIDGYILNAHVNGKVYGQFHPLRGNDNGARSGRFSSSNPNLQNLSSRDELIAPLIRGMFVPDAGHVAWRAYDYSQIEYRFLVHFAIGEGSDEVREKYKNDPKTDYHKLTQLLVKEKTGIELKRKPVKNINFGLCIAEGQLVLTDRGHVPIQCVEDDDMLWDGVEWAPHAGVVCNGHKEVITYQGLTATKDHEVFCEDGRSCTLAEARDKGKRLESLRGSTMLYSKCEEQETSKVFDILNAGPRNRFFCQGVLVHNCYGMGKPKLAAGLGVTIKEAERLFTAYHSGAPFVKATMQQCMDIAASTGEITTVTGRKSRFELFVPKRRDRNKMYIPVPYERALRQWGPNIGRAYLHKALNRRLQGSAADMLKIAMLKCYEDGIFDDIGVPRLTVHDELDLSDPGGKDEGFEEMKHVMENAMALRVPILVDAEIGPDWGHMEDM